MHIYPWGCFLLSYLLFTWQRRKTHKCSVGKLRLFTCLSRHWFDLCGCWLAGMEWASCSGCHLINHTDLKHSYFLGSNHLISFFFIVVGVSSGIGQCWCCGSQRFERYWLSCWNRLQSLCIQNEFIRGKSRNMSWLFGCWSEWEESSFEGVPFSCPTEYILHIPGADNNQYDHTCISYSDIL